MVQNNQLIVNASQKRAITLLSVTSEIAHQFSNFFTSTLVSKYVIKLSIKIPHLKHIATLPCETSSTFLTHSDQSSGYLAPSCMHICKLFSPTSWKRGSLIVKYTYNIWSKNDKIQQCFWQRVYNQSSNTLHAQYDSMQDIRTHYTASFICCTVKWFIWLTELRFQFPINTKTYNFKVVFSSQLLSMVHGRN